MLKIKLFNYQTGEFQETILTPETTAQGECLIGRASNCDLVLDSPEVSRVHGRIKSQQDAYHYTDLGSANGSQINNQEVQVNQSYGLKVNDLIRIGDFLLLVEAIETTPDKAEPSIWQKLGGDRHWTKGDLTVRCVRIVAETSDVKTFTFVADPPVLFSYKPGQFVTLELDINGEQVLRSYSISSTPSRPHTLDITVKRVAAPADAPNAPPGLVSNWLHDHLKLGSQIKLSGPFGKFTCLPNPAPKLLLISAGSGITPMMSMARWMADTATETDITFFHCARTPRDIIFRQELEMMSARLPNFRLAFSTTQPEPGQPWCGFTGRLSAVMLQTIAPDFQERTVYVCGPDGFMQAVKTLLESLNFPMQNYHEESFGVAKKPKKSKKPENATPAPLPASAQPQPSNNGYHKASSLVAASSSAVAIASPPVVLFAQSGKEAAFDDAESILDLAEQEGIKIRSSCRQGVCGVCKKRKREGEIKYESTPDALDSGEQAEGYILPCIAAPMGRVVIEA